MKFGLLFILGGLLGIVLAIFGIAPRDWQFWAITLTLAVTIAYLF